MPIAPSAEFLQLQPVVAGRYSLERELGRGGMGVVFLARDVALDRPVALKLLPPALASQPHLRERFLREARTAAKLSHPNIVPIHLVEEHGDVVYFVMTFVDGETLGQRVRRAGSLTASQATRMMQEVAWALAYAHGRGVVHRDIKPDNILLDKDTGRAMVTDFGIAHVAERGTLSGAGELVGTANYMSPEQASGESVDGRSDLFSLGVTTFYSLTGKLPFDGPNLPAVVLKIVNADAPRLMDIRPDLPAQLADAVHRCLEKGRDERFASGEELAEAVGAGAVSTEAAPEVRFLIRSVDELGQPLTMLVLAALILPSVWSVMWETNDGTVLMVTGMLLFPIVTAPLQLLFATRRVIKAGLSFADVRLAFDRASRRFAEENPSTEAFADTPERAAIRSTRWMWLGHTCMLGALGLVASPLRDQIGSRGMVLGLLLLSATLSVLGYAAGLSLKRKPKQLKQYYTTGKGISDRLNTRFLGWLFRLAGTGLEVRAQNEPPASERTEVLLASAAGDVFDRLPSELRNRFAAVPALIRKLEADAFLLRRRDDELRRATSGASRPEETQAARAQIRERLASAVAALESIRLDLMRLDAGVGSPDDLTADLERARAIGAAVDAEVYGRTEVARLLATPT